MSWPRIGSHWVLGGLGLLGLGFAACWWPIRSLGDVRLHLGRFYGWFALAFGIYLAALGLIARLERPGLSRRTLALAVAGILAAAFLARLALLGTTPSLSPDLYRYRWDARVQRAGIDPYRYPPDAPELAFLRDETFARIDFPHLRTVYPPLAELAFRIGSSIGDGPSAQKIVFLAAEWAVVPSLLFILLSRRRSVLWVAAYAWHPLVVLEFSGSGHNDALGIAFLWIGLAFWQAGRWLGCTLAWASAFLSKFASFILVPWWWLRRQARGWLLAFLALSASILLCCPSLIRAIRDTFSAVATRFESNASLYLLLARLAADAALARWLCAGMWVGFLFWWARREADPLRYLFGALAAAAFCSPALHPWYLTWLVPFFCFWRPAFLVALSATVVLSYTQWKPYLSEGRWGVPDWARALEYGPVIALALWQALKSRQRSFVLR